MCGRGASLGGTLHARPHSWWCSSSSGKDRSILASAMAAAKNGADALDDKYSSEAAESMPLAELVEAPSSVGNSYGLPRAHTLRYV